jgi:CelD/BcsL family acetyltransferase involved in cellulose biosynthesis
VAEKYLRPGESVSGYRISSSIVENPQDLEQEWCALQARADCSYFQSWGWIGVWLEQIAAEFDPLIVRVWYGSSLVGLGIFVHRIIRRRLFINSNALFLNEYPFDGRNMSIEYNGLLAEHDHRERVYAEVIDHLFRTNKGLDEVFFGGVDASTVVHQGLAQSGFRPEHITLQLLEESSTWAVDLGSIGTGMDAYLETLSRNRRAQIRRSIRLYEAYGPLRLEEAKDLVMAREFFSGLKKLHTLRWQKEGKQGVFANPVWGNLHRALIKSRFPEGEIQLLRVRNDNAVIGYLYNLVWRKKVYVLQTGFESQREKGLMPGYVVHAMAIEHNRKLGIVMYDLMHGDELYKQIMCDRYQQLQWLVLQRPRIRFRIENLALALKRSFTAR